MQCDVVGIVKLECDSGAWRTLSAWIRELVADAVLLVDLNGLHQEQLRHFLEQWE